MKRSYVSRDYTRQLRAKLQSLKQGTLGVRDYYFEMCALRNKIGGPAESEEVVLTRFLGGLNRTLEIS